ncbi:hypothetical protein [Paenibacillus sp. CMAA1364]
MTRKRYLNLFLAIIIIITSLLAQETAQAAEQESDGSIQLGLQFNRDTGDLQLQTVNKKATSGIRYQSVGWVIRTDKTCTGSDVLTSECTPLSDSKYLRINIGDAGLVAGEDKDHTDGTVLSTFTMNADAFKAKVKTSGISELKSGQQVRVSTIFRVKIGATLLAQEYTTLSSIRGAQAWANKGGFRQYYDQPITFYSKEEFRVKKVRKSDGVVLDSTINAGGSNYLVENPDSPSKKWPGGSPISTPILLTDNANTKQYSKVPGKTYKLVGSYIVNEMDKVTASYTTATKDAPNWKRASDVVTRKPNVQFGGSTLIALYEESSKIICNCDSELNIPDSSNFGGEVIGAKIGKEVPVNIRTKLSDEDLETWVIAMKTATNTKLKVDIIRTDKGPNNTGAVPIITGSPTTGVANPIDNDDLIKYFKGVSSLNYKDNLSNYPIPEDGKVEFAYNAKLTITYTAGGVTHTIECDAGDETLLKFFRKKKLDVNVFGTYTSSPSYWSEIKEGTPNNETFEAMAGTPTTRNIYYASGGSEFIVNIETEYVANATATRSYKSYFTSVPSGWTMAPITGGKQKDSPPSRPTPRRATDVSGASYTETVSQQSGPYTKVPGVPGSGTAGQPGYVAPIPPVMGTEYWWVQEGYSKQVGGYEDNWTQTSTFDYTKINKAQVWKIDRSKVDGMTTLLGTEEITATIQQGDPVLFSNIATSNTSSAGRLRYSLETGQHDTVIWNEGSSDNRDANSDSDSYVNEKDKFKERRALTTGLSTLN